ncbi:MAG: ABC transporter permease [Sphingomonadales bacterium]|nr:ABC transporter permease [Sphingomonadales bacterium]NCO48688.1 ABC transporter permease [Sphingomonadales bacterium]NCP25963.1 ABC transporter permease [Sphingomonadales bacterium]NCP43209.1 ABC transporter permease [Sphingomonadales bacterium]NCP47923.1 ABC transporter permease [Sphingomonadales bacterium]
MIETIRAAYVIARRDFTAIIFSKSFFFFLLGPLFPLGIGVAAGGLGSQVSRDIDNSIIGVAMNPEETDRLLATRQRLSQSLGTKALPELVILKDFSAQEADIISELSSNQSYAAILSGTLAEPVLTGSSRDVERWRGKIALMAETALSRPAAVNIQTRFVEQTGSSSERNQLLTAQAGQAILILLTMILAGMVLSNLVEEKTNKIIEILAAAIPMDAIFLGKLFAMLGMALVGIAVWTTLGLTVVLLFGGNAAALPSPAVGWPLFCLLLVVYFSMAYLLLGSLFLGIGAMATTVREVQTLSMPVTMGQLLVFFLAYSSITKLGEPVEWFAVLFPFSSPFAMIARAAQMNNVWQHGLALIWQAVFTMIIIRFSVMLFRRNVMKSGQAARKKSLLARVTGK